MTRLRKGREMAKKVNIVGTQRGATAMPAVSAGERSKKLGCGGDADGGVADAGRHY